jgi:hypothetical protein
VPPELDDVVLKAVAPNPGQSVSERRGVRGGAEKRRGRPRFAWISGRRRGPSRGGTARKSRRAGTRPRCAAHCRRHRLVVVAMIIPAGSRPADR